MSIVKPNGLSLWTKTLFGMVTKFRFRYNKLKVADAGITFQMIKERLSYVFKMEGILVVFEEPRELSGSGFAGDRIYCDFIVDRDYNIANLEAILGEWQKMVLTSSSSTIPLWFNEAWEPSDASSDFGIDLNYFITGKEAQIDEELSLWTRNLMGLYTQIDVELPHDFPTYCRDMFFAQLEEILNGHGFLWEYMKPIHSRDWKIEIKVYQDLNIDDFTRLVTMRPKDPTSPSDYQIVFRFPGQKFNLQILHWSYSGFYKKPVVFEALSPWTKELFHLTSSLTIRYSKRLAEDYKFDPAKMIQLLKGTLNYYGIRWGDVRGPIYMTGEHENQEDAKIEIEIDGNMRGKDFVDKLPIDYDRGLSYGSIGGLPVNITASEVIDGGSISSYGFYYREDRGFYKKWRDMEFNVVDLYDEVEEKLSLWTQALILPDDHCYCNFIDLGDNLNKGETDWVDKLLVDLKKLFRESSLISIDVTDSKLWKLNFISTIGSQEINGLITNHVKFPTKSSEYLIINFFRSHIEDSFDFKFLWNPSGGFFRYL